MEVNAETKQRRHGGNVNTWKHDKWYQFLSIKARTKTLVHDTAPVTMAENDMVCILAYRNPMIWENIIIVINHIIT